MSDFFSAGVDFSSPRDMALDAGRGRLVVADLGLDAVVAVDITTGTRTILSDATHGTGPALVDPERIVVVAGLDEALVITRGSDDLIGVNLADGDRVVVSGASHGAGPALLNPEMFTTGWQASPEPSWLASSCPGLAVAGQLSHASPSPSLSRFAWSWFATEGQLSQMSPTPS